MEVKTVCSVDFACELLKMTTIFLLHTARPTTNFQLKNFKTFIGIQNSFCRFKIVTQFQWGFELGYTYKVLLFIYLFSVPKWIHKITRKGKSLNTYIPTFRTLRYWHCQGKRNINKYLTVRRDVFPYWMIDNNRRAFRRFAAVNLYCHIKGIDRASVWYHRRVRFIFQ